MSDTRFSEEGTPFFMDSQGIVRMLNQQFGSTWTPVLNTRQHVRILPLYIIIHISIFLVFSFVQDYIICVVNIIIVCHFCPLTEIFVQNDLLVSSCFSLCLAS